MTIDELIAWADNHHDKVLTDQSAHEALCAAAAAGIAAAADLDADFDALFGPLKSTDQTTREDT
jgi:hypothetical protein